MKIKYTGIICLLAVMGFTGSLYAVGGVTGSKLFTPSADPVSQNDFEFESTVSSYRARLQFNEFGAAKDIPDVLPWWLPEERKSFSSSNIGFRLTGGFFQNFEAGVSFGYLDSHLLANKEAGMDDIRYGMKYVINPENPLRFALEGGVNLNPKTWAVTSEAGMIVTWDVTKNFSIDTDIVNIREPAQRDKMEKFRPEGYAGNIAMGYRIGNFQPIVELGYSEMSSMRLRNYRVTKEVQGFSTTSAPVEYDMSAILGINTSIPVHVPGIGIIPYNVPLIQEKARVWERLHTVTTGFTYKVNDRSLFIASYSEDIKGVNSYKGKNIAITVTFLIPSEKSGDNK